MKNYKVLWTDSDGRPHASVVSYDKDSAKTRKEQLVAQKARSVQIVETRPGEVLEPRA